MCIASALTVLAHILLIVLCFRTRAKRRCLKKIVHLPFALAAVGMVCGSVMCIPVVVCAISGERTGWFFCLTVLFCDSLMVAYRNCVIRFDDNGFTARNFLGIRRSCGYGNVEGLRTGKDKRLYFQGHSILLDEMSLGTKEFLVTLKRGYSREKGKIFPEDPSFKRRWDPMNGHLDYPWLYFILWIVMIAICLGIPGIAIWAVCEGPNTAPLELRQVQFVRHDAQNQAVGLYMMSEEEPLLADWYLHYEPSLPDPDVFCNGELWTVGTEAGSRYILYLASSDGTEYITPVREYEAYRSSQLPAVWILCAVCPVGVIFSIFGILVGRNPDRFSQRVRRMYYKDGYLH